MPTNSQNYKPYVHKFFLLVVFVSSSFVPCQSFDEREQRITSTSVVVI